MPNETLKDQLGVYSKYRFHSQRQYIDFLEKANSPRPYMFPYLNQTLFKFKKLLLKMAFDMTSNQVTLIFRKSFRKQ